MLNVNRYDQIIMDPLRVAFALKHVSRFQASSRDQGVMTAQSNLACAAYPADAGALHPGWQACPVHHDLD
jgi:hypothetical protein